VWEQVQTSFETSNMTASLVSPVSRLTIGGVKASEIVVATMMIPRPQMDIEMATLAVGNHQPGALLDALPVCEAANVCTLLNPVVRYVDTILFGAGMGDQVHDWITSLFLAERGGAKMLDQDLRLSFSESPQPARSIFNYSHPVIRKHVQCLPESYTSRYKTPWDTPLLSKCNQSVTKFGRHDNRQTTNFTASAMGILATTSLHVFMYDPCNLARGAGACTWLKDRIANNPGLFVDHLDGLVTERASDTIKVIEKNTTCVHMRINDKYMAKISTNKSFDIGFLPAIKVVDEDNFGCSYHIKVVDNSQAKNKSHVKLCNFDALNFLTFQNYMRAIVQSTAASSAKNLYIMCPLSLERYTKHLEQEFGVRIFTLSDFTKPSFLGRDSPHADRIICSKSTIFAGTKSSFSSVTKMMRGYRNWRFLHQYYNISAVTRAMDEWDFTVADWEWG
jgi:hypothetical protein